MARKFSELEAKMSPERRARIAEEVKATLAEIPLNELRNALGLSKQCLTRLCISKSWTKFQMLRIP